MQTVNYFFMVLKAFKNLGEGYQILRGFWHLPWWSSSLHLAFAYKNDKFNCQEIFLIAENAQKSKTKL